MDSSKPLYHAEIVEFTPGKFEQRFIASYLCLEHVDETRILGFSEAKIGATHGLTVMSSNEEDLDPDDVYIEFNDQINGRSLSEVSIILQPRVVIFCYKPGAEVLSGRISYDENADFLENAIEAGIGQPLTRVVIELNVNVLKEAIATMNAEFRRLKIVGM
ncbi:MAG: hypothetical protein F6K09_37325 [Merismopedia sp. SIO2A8]|nr:hypothetical protein [Merismopedia sp. SIO2A8]